MPGPGAKPLASGHGVVSGHVMTAASAVALLDDLTAAGVDPCVGGGWAVDALIGEQTREHSDLDLWVEAPNLDPLVQVLTRRGVDRLLPWGGDRPWNFVLHDGEHVRVDLHLYEQLAQGLLHYGIVVRGAKFPAESLHGTGLIAGRRVRCDSLEWAVECHTGYAPRAVDRQDVGRLCARFGLDLPVGYR